MLHSNAVPAAPLDNNLFTAVIGGINLWNADGAGDFQLAGRTLHQRAMSSQGKDSFPKLLAVNWDCTHGGRKLTERPWKTDSYLTMVLQATLD